MICYVFPGGFRTGISASSAVAKAVLLATVFPPLCDHISFTGRRLCLAPLVLCDHCHLGYDPMTWVVSLAIFSRVGAWCIRSVSSVNLVLFL